MRKVWTPAEDIELRRLYPNTLTAELAAKFGATKFGVYQRAHRIGLHKSPEFTEQNLRECGRQASQHQAALASRFPKGHVPANKGLRRPGWAPGRMRETQFKKGQTPRNTMPMWSFRFVDGYLMVKTGAPTPKPATGWEYVHKLIWERWNGPLPDWREARIWWKDGDHANCSLSNLELVRGRDHVLRTSVHNLPAPLPQLIQLAGALKRKIRTREEKLNGEKHIAGSKGSPVRDAGVAF